MEETKVLRREFDFQAYECDALKEYLEEMAKMGWILVRCKRFLTFEKREPQDISYKIAIGGKSERPDVDDTREFIGRHKNIRIYRAKGEASDFLIKEKRESQIQSISAVTFRQNRTQWTLYPILLLLIIIINYKKFPEVLSSGFDVTLFSLYLFLILPVCLQFLWFLRWKRKVGKEKESSVFQGKKEWGVQRRQAAWLNRAILFFLTTLMMWYLGKEQYFVMLYILIFMAVSIYGMVMSPRNTFGSSKFQLLQSIKINGILSILVTLVLGIGSFQVLENYGLIQNQSLFESKGNVYYAPVTQEDFIYTTTNNTLDSAEIAQDSFETIYSNKENYSEVEISRKKSILAWESKYIQGDLSYRIFESPYSTLLSLYRISNSKGYTEVDPKKWEAQKAYFWNSKTGYYNYLIQYEKYVLSFRCNWELSDSEIEVIVEKL